MDIYYEIWTERRRQDKIWGGPEHDDNHESSDWAGFISQRSSEMEVASQGRIRERELFLHIAALAVAALESLDRKYNGSKG